VFPFVLNLEMDSFQSGWMRLNSPLKFYYSQVNHGFLTAASYRAGNILIFISHLAGGRRHWNHVSAAFMVSRTVKLCLPQALFSFKGRKRKDGLLKNGRSSISQDIHSRH
jgi:hypothetical protein